MVIQEAEIYSAEDKKFGQIAEVKNALDDCVYKIATVLKKHNINLKLSSLENKRIAVAITRAQNLLDENHQLEIDVLQNHLKEFNCMHLFCLMRINSTE